MSEMEVSRMFEEHKETFYNEACNNCPNFGHCSDSDILMETAADMVKEFTYEVAKELKDRLGTDLSESVIERMLVDQLNDMLIFERLR